MMKEDIEKILEKRRETIKKIDEAYDKILNANTRVAGLQELESLRGQDRAIPCIIGYAHEMNFYECGYDVEEAKMAIQEYQKAFNKGGYDFLKNDIDRITKDAGL